MLECFLNFNKIKMKRLKKITWAIILFTIEHREHNRCLYGYILHFYPLIVYLKQF